MGTVKTCVSTCFVQPIGFFLRQKRPNVWFWLIYWKFLDSGRHPSKRCKVSKEEGDVVMEDTESMYYFLCVSFWHTKGHHRLFQSRSLWKGVCTCLVFIFI
jgi:hypothetical protein